nr:RNA pseudouridine synthase [uncultured Carboxylicivirga sp.]
MSKKHQLKGLEIIFEDQDIIVVNKASGLLTIATVKEKIHTAHYMLNEYVKKGNSKSRARVFIVHRLDRDTSGLLLFAKNERSKLFLQQNWTDFQKKYIAVVHGILTEKQGVIESYLQENSACHVFSTPDNNRGKYAKTEYKVLKESAGYSLLEVKLYTGRKNQIRVHLSEQGHSIVGDRMYGKVKLQGARLALHSSSLVFTHPFSKKEMSFKTNVPQSFNSYFKHNEATK